MTRSVGLVVTEAGVNDNSFNASAYAGLALAGPKLGVETAVYTATSPGDYDLLAAQCATDGRDLFLGVGFVFESGFRTAAASHPGTSFALVDVDLADGPANLRGIVFAEDQVGYLAGYLAGLMTRSRIVGAVGGIPRVVGLHHYRGIWPSPVLPGLHLVGDSVFPGQSVLATALGGYKLGTCIVEPQIHEKAAS